MDVRDLEDTICYLCRDPLPSRNQASPSPPTLSPVPPPPTPPTNRRPNVQPSPPTRATSFSHNSTRCQCLWRSHGNQQRPQRLRCVNSRRCRYNCYTISSQSWSLDSLFFVFIRNRENSFSTNTNGHVSPDHLRKRQRQSIRQCRRRPELISNVD